MKNVQVSSLAVTLILLLWYLPHRHFIHYILSIQSEVSMNTTLESAWLKLKSNYEWYSVHPDFQFSVGLFWLNVVAIPILIWYRQNLKISAATTATLIFMVLWLCSEVWKMSNNYLPERYLLSAVICCSLLFFILLYEFIKGFTLPGFVWPALLCALILLQLPPLYQSYLSRTFVLRDLNTYLIKTLSTQQPVMGNWAASCCWEPNVPLKTLARGVHNHEATLEKHRPQLVVTETDEADSDKLFEQQGIQLYSIADSVKQVQIGHWQLGLYWLSP